MKIISGALLTSIALISLQTYGDEPSESYSAEARDAYLSGKIETIYTLNRHLNTFAINTEVTEGNVRLTGAVSSDIDRDLAVELAKNVGGVVSVRSELIIEPQSDLQSESENVAPLDGNRTFGAWVDDATTTAAVKAKLVRNANTQGMKIDVDTHGDVVTLSGRVTSAEGKQLAEEIARSTGDVSDVHNLLVVDSTF
jgi:osmotically-inducible protein OsmY